MKNQISLAILLVFITFFAGYGVCELFKTDTNNQNTITDEDWVSFERIGWYNNNCVEDFFDPLAEYAGGMPDSINPMQIAVKNNVYATKLIYILNGKQYYCTIVCEYDGEKLIDVKVTK